MIKQHPEDSLKVYNLCLSKIIFPAKWKEARLVLLRKGPDKPIDSPSSSRPVCLMGTMSKVLERL